MKPDIRWQVLLAIVGFALALGLLSLYTPLSGSAGPTLWGGEVCTTPVPAAGGVVYEGMVGLPQTINPLLSDHNPVDRELVSLVFDGLTRYEQGELVPALAQEWSVSDDGRIVRFTLRQDATWHDGTPVTSNDVAFTYGLMQDEAFPGDAALQRLWQSVQIRPVSDTVIEFELTEPYSPFLEATTRGILPAHRLEGVTAATLADAEFNREPIGTGPFMVEPNQDWQDDHTLLLTPFPAAWPQAPQIDHLGFRFYPDEATLLEAFQVGEIEAINSVSPVMLPAVMDVPGARLFSAVAPRYTSLLFNLSDSGSPATRSVEVRRALAYALDRDALVDEVLNGQGVPLTGPYLPSSWAYSPGLLTPYASEPLSATVGLENAGWVLPEGAPLRQREGTPLTLRFLVWDTPTNRAMAEAITRQWTAVGAAPQLSFFTDWREFHRELAARNFDVALVDVAPPHDPDLYDFWSQEAVVRGQNYAGWNRRRASEALESARQVWSTAERKPFYETFLRLYDEDLPELTLFQHVYTYALSDAVHGAEIGRIDQARDRYATLPGWFLNYRDVPIACPTEPATAEP